MTPRTYLWLGPGLDNLQVPDMGGSRWGRGGGGGVLLAGIPSSHPVGGSPNVLDRGGGGRYPDALHPLQNPVSAPDVILIVGTLHVI